MRLLCFNCHEAWIAQLDGLPHEIDILVGLSGRDQRGWDERARPLPRNARLVEQGQVEREGASYDAILVHNPSDLIAARRMAAPRVLVIHNTLEGRLVEEGGGVDGAAFKRAFGELLRRTGTYAIAVSPLKAASWNLPDGTLRAGVRVGEFGPYVGSEARGLRVANHVDKRRRILNWDFHQAAFGGVPLTLVGTNPGHRGSGPARSFQHLKDLMRVHRFYVHTADPVLEDGYNLASLEAMASGLPVLGHPHPSSPVRHGIDGYLSADPRELERYARELLQDRDRAAAMGAAARARVQELFPEAAFATGLTAVVARARQEYEAWRASCLVHAGAEV